MLLSSLLFLAYSFLDPKKQGAMIAAYIAGIGIGNVVVFAAAWGIIRLREFLVAKYGKAPIVAGEVREDGEKGDS